MIGSLRGTVLERTPPQTVLIDVAGIGYLCTVTPATFAELEPTVQTFVYVHHHIREDAQTLYAFTQRDERDTFHALIGAHGVGPAMALAILAVHTPRALHDIVVTGDIAALTLVPGIGKKSAERIMIEVKSRLLSADISLPSSSLSATSIVGEVREALVGLGYGQEEIRDALRELDGNSSREQLLRDALSLLGARRA
jgi:holliday junction DNA helicase RuvA